jgi:sterol desaturase/sphingolipid hydroxylase (fatty acid hydroxylase superfamily)
MAAKAKKSKSRKYTDIIFEVKDQVAWITINREKVLNAFREQTLDEMIDALKSTREDPSIVCAVVTGKGNKSFSAGGDFYAMKRLNFTNAYMWNDRMLGLAMTIRGLPIPVIAMVNGWCMGGGHELALWCDLVIASENAVLGQTGAKVGACPTVGATQYIPRIIGILFPLLVGPLLFNSSSIAAALGNVFGMAAAPATPASFPMLLAYTVVFFIAYDFGRFAAHSLLHDIPWLWQFHKVHHSAEVLTPITSFRAHPVDLAVMAWVPALTTGIVTWVFHRYVDPGIGVITFLGTHVILWVFNLVGNLRHWQVWLSYGPMLNRWLISPAHHQLHHSYEPRHLGCNRGFELAVWDRLYGTLYVPPQAPEQFRMGLGDDSDGQWRKVWQLYWWPFKSLWKRAPADKAP